MSKNLLKVKKSSTAMAIFQSRQCLFQSSHFVDKRHGLFCPCLLSGRSGETWTRGLTVPNRTRYQTALHPDKYVFCFNLLWRVWERVAHFRQVLRPQQQFRWYVLLLKCTSFDSLNFSQTKLRYTPSVNLIAYAIYINLQIFATKLRQLSKKLYLDCVFLAEVDKIVCKMRIVWYIIIVAMELGVVVALGPLTPTV